MMVISCLYLQHVRARSWSLSGWGHMHFISIFFFLMSLHFIVSCPFGTFALFDVKHVCAHVARSCERSRSRSALFLPPICRALSFLCVLQDCARGGGLQKLNCTLARLCARRYSSSVKVAGESIDLDAGRKKNS